jgi:Bacterial Ig-like domain
MSTRVSCYLLLIFICIGAGCANITAPTGGKKDTRPPKLVSIDPGDSIKNTRPNRIELHFDEYVTVNDVATEVQLSPILAIQPTIIGKNKTVIVKIVDSLLEENTTYRVSFGKSIKDLHEGNPFKMYTYVFSTGSYFDSLELHGKVINAVTGLPDSGNVMVELYYSKENDSAVVRQKPKYVVKADANGEFAFNGLPKRSFRIYAIKENNNNLIYDGPVAGEKIAFTENSVMPGDTDQVPVRLMLFAEVPDTATKKNMDSLANKREGGLNSKNKQKGNDAFNYTVNIDTTNAEKRTFEITGPIKITFNKLPVLNKEKITLTYDSANVTITPEVTFFLDSAKNMLRINTNWREHTVYKIRLAKGFAKDTGGVEVMPSKYVFQTKEDDDYGKIVLHLPAKYKNTKYLLKVMADYDSVYQKPVTDTMVYLVRLKPAKYTFRIIVDENRNGKWDAGDLFNKKQPEEVIPYTEPLTLKAGWDNRIDWEQKPAVKKGMQPDK